MIDTKGHTPCDSTYKRENDVYQGLGGEGVGVSHGQSLGLGRWKVLEMDGGAGGETM